MDRRCQACGARCCRYFCFEIDKPETYADFENIRWYLMHKNISVYVDMDGQWCILIENLCRMLRKTARLWRCADYENRPAVCRQFSPRRCDFTRAFHEVEEFFQTGDELEAYARRMLGERAFERARAQARRKAARSARRKGDSR